MMETDIERPVISYRNTSKCYRITEKEQENSFINRQYFSTYRVRLSALRERVLIAAKKAGVHNYRSLEALPDEGKCLIIGTIIKRIGLRPSILKELAHDEHLIPEDDMPETADVNVPEIRSLVSQQDYLEMEDDKQLVKIVGVDMNAVATGCVIGIFGQRGNEDTFVVEEIIWPAAGTQLEWPLKKPKGKIAILSGLEITGDSETDKSTLMKLATFTRWFTGVLADNKENKELVASVERILIVGDSIFLNGNREISSAVRNLRLIPKDVNIPTIEAVEQLDRHLCHLTSKMQVDIVPGVGDPATQLWPQQPIHRTCLPKASVSGKALGLRTNPYSFILGGIDFLATSEDILRMSTVGDSLKVMESILNWQHIAPTAPDTLDAFPMDQRDPLIMQRRPHVLICGNQGQSSKKWVETDDGKTLLITVSRFSKTGDVQILDLNSMEHLGMAIDKSEYLKKYTSRATKEKKKKDHKDSRLKIIESDAFLPVNSKVSEDEEEDDIEIRALNEEIHQKVKKGGAKGGFKSTFVEIEDEVKKEIKEDSNQSYSHQMQSSARKRHDSDSDLFPPRKESRVRANEKDLSPPRKKKISRSPANSSTRKRHDSDSDLSPPRKRQKSRDDSEDLSPPRRRKGASIDHVSSPRRKHTTTKYEKTLDGKKAGLQNSKDLREESNKIRKEESRIFEQLDDSVTGRNSKTRVRTNQRQSKGNEKDLEKKKREAEKQLELEEKYSKWNKGLLQQKEREEQLEEMRRVAEGPMTRSADDKDMNRYLKEQILTEDPMASLIIKRNREEAIDRGELVYPIYEKSFPPNRYSIRPGYRWDGVDRSNRFENKLMVSRNIKEASKHDDYIKWQNVEA